jgi:UrcA family protein
MTQSLTKRIVLGLTLSLTIGSIANAEAMTVSDSGVTSVSVSAAGLDLSSQAGAGVFLARLRHAATLACGDLVSSSADLYAWSNYRSCTQGALDDAVRTLGAPQVTALYRERVGHPTVVTALRPDDAPVHGLTTAFSPPS